MNTGTRNEMREMQGTRAIFTSIPENLSDDSGKCWHFNIPGNVQEDSGECSRWFPGLERFQGMFKKIPKNVQMFKKIPENVHEDSGECLRGFRRTLKKITNVKSCFEKWSAFAILYETKERSNKMIWYSFWNSNWK